MKVTGSKRVRGAERAGQRSNKSREPVGAAQTREQTRDGEAGLQSPPPEPPSRAARPGGGPGPGGGRGLVGSAAG